MLSAEGFSLSVPEGAFASTETLSVTILGTSEEFGTDALTPLYRVDGIPTDFILPLRLDLRCERTPIPGHFLLVGGEAESQLSGERETFYDGVPAIFSNGLLSADVAPSQAHSAQPRGIPAGMAGEGLPIGKWFLGIDNTDTLLSEGGHFRLLYRRYMEGQARGLARHFENAFDSCTAAGFDRSGFYEYLSWPFSVEIRNHCGESKEDLALYGLRPVPGTGRVIVNFSFDECLLVSSPPPLNTFVALNFTSVLGEANVVRTQERHSGLTADQMLQFAWLMISVAEWAQELVLPPAARSSYVAPDFAGRWKVPFHGLSIPQGYNMSDHGVGWAPLLKHLAEGQGGATTVTAAFHEVLNQPNGVNALLTSVSEAEYIWLPGFFRKYIAGELYDVQADSFLTTIGQAEEFTIDGIEDTLRHFVHPYPDLSAKLYRVNLRFGNLSEDATITFAVGPQSLNVGYVDVVVFTYAGGELAYQSMADEVTIAGVRELTASGYDLVAAVVNSASEPPYEGTSNIELDVMVSPSIMQTP